MKILDIKIKDHPILGNLELDFTVKNKNGEILPAKSIIIAGDNGTGKSTLLELLKLNFINHTPNLQFSFFLNLSISNNEIERFKKIVEKMVEKGRLRFNNSINEKLFFEDVNQNKLFLHYGFNKSIKSVTWNMILKDESLIYIDFVNLFIKNIYWNTDNIKNKNHNTDGTTNENMLINLSIQDALDYQHYMKAQPSGYTITEEDVIQTNKRVRIFESSFNNFFESTNLKFEKIERSIGGNSNIFFKKNNKEFNTNNFSKGEYQIFSGSCEILKNKSVEEPIILIDEPENGLHPDWQSKLLSYYRNISENKQLIFSTHSPFIINSASDEDKVIILKRKVNNKIDCTSDEYYGLPEIKTLSYKMNITSTPGILKLIVGGKTDEIYLDFILKIFKNEHSIFSKIKIIYPFVDNDILGEDYGGDTSLINFHRGYNFMEDTKFVWFIYDWDLIPKQKNQISNFKNTYILEKQDTQNIKLQIKSKLKGIENTVDFDDEIMRKSKCFNFLLDEETGKKFITFKKDSKLKLANYLTKSLSKKSFIPLKNELLKIIEESKFEI